MRTRKLIIIFTIAAIASVVISINLFGTLGGGDIVPSQKTSEGTSKKESEENILETPVMQFADNFDVAEIIAEGGNILESKNPNWWVSSGAYLYRGQGIGNTIIGALPQNDRWRLEYAASNPLDTDNGYHPQNIFRLVLRSEWKNYTQQAYFKIIGDNLSVSPNRNESNGILLFNRYQDAFNLYYTGVRVDGKAVIKKKIGGVYHTLALEPFIDGKYDEDENPNLLPKGIWIGLRSTVENFPDGSVSVKLFVDKNKSGNWTLVAETVDDGKKYGTALAKAGKGGIRTDFMDVEFSGYRIFSLSDE